MKIKFNTYTEAKVESQLESDAQSLDVGQRRGKQPIKLEYGHNVLWWIPSVNPVYSSAWKHLLLHWNPLHVCSRTIVENPSDPSKYIIERNFDRCFRCSQSWKHHDDAGRSDESYEKQYKLNRSKHHVAMCAVNLSPFFMVKSSSDPYAKPNQPVIDAHMDAFLDIVRAVSLGEEPVIREGTPEDVVKAGKQGVGIVLVSKDIGVMCRDSFKKKFVEMGEEDPLEQPDKTLLQITRQNDPSSKWKDSTGKSRDSTKYDAGFLPLSAKTWTFPDRLYSILQELMDAGKMPDIWEIGKEDDSDKTIKDKALSLAGLSNMDMKQYLLDMNHEFLPASKNQDAPMSSSPTSQSSGSTMSNSAIDLDAVLGDEAAQAGALSLKERLQMSKKS